MKGVYKMQAIINGREFKTQVTKEYRRRYPGQVRYTPKVMKKVNDKWRVAISSSSLITKEAAQLAAEQSLRGLPEMLKNYPHIA